jgi:exodeoxyribonuclease VII small subunit
MNKKKEETSFEKSFERLEKILEMMHSENVSLDDSLKLYEEADSLINTCQNKLNDAERKIEKLIKNREGHLETNDEGAPVSEDFE